MYFKPQTQNNLLVIDEDFAHLDFIEKNGELKFELLYKISPQEAISRNATVVNVTVFSKTIKRPALLQRSHVGLINVRLLVDNVLSQLPDAKSAAKQQEEFVVAFKRSDIFAKINNEVVSQLGSRASSQNIPQLRQSRLKLKQVSSINEKAETRPILQTMAYSSMTNIELDVSSSFSIDSKTLIHDMVVRQGIDPSYVFELTHRSVPSIDSVGGMLKKQRAYEVGTDPSVKLLNHYLNPPKTLDRYATTEQIDDSEMVHVFENEPITMIDVPISVTIPKHKSLAKNKEYDSQLFVKFELIDSKTLVAIDTVVKTLDVAKHVQFYLTPKFAPVVKATHSDLTSKANIEIKQIDPGASAVKIYKKRVFRSSTDVDDYALIGTFNVKHDEQSLLVPVDSLSETTSIYRVIPVGQQGTLGHEYSNVILKSGRFRQIKSLALTTQLTETGIKLEVTHIPRNVVSFEFKVRNMTTFEKEYRNVGESIVFVDDASRIADHVTLIDGDVIPENVYEYVVKLIYGSGTSEIVGNNVVEFLKPTPGKVDTKIENVIVDHSSEPNVTFNLSTTIIDNNIDIIKTLLQRQDIYDLFKDDVAREREFIKSLIAHNVKRIDLTTGDKENFGIITSTLFSDRDLRKNQAIQPLKVGHKYRYEITALLRAPETMFELLSKEKFDPITKKTYTFNPSKFLHPITLNRGVLMTSQGLKTRYAKEAMSHGIIGTIESVDVSFDSDNTIVLDSSASRFDRHTNVITWKTQGSIDAIDHFVIIKDVLGVRTLIGKAHSEFSYGNCQYLHRLTQRDLGALRYVIIPVLNTYEIGAESITNVVVIDDVPTN